MHFFYTRRPSHKLWKADHFIIYNRGVKTDPLVIGLSLKLATDIIKFTDINLPSVMMNKSVDHLRLDHFNFF